MPVPGREAVGAVCPEMDSWTEMGRSSAFAVSIVIGAQAECASRRGDAKSCVRAERGRCKLLEGCASCISQIFQTG